MRSLALACLLLFPTAASAQTVLPGGNTGTTTWTLSGSPYVVNGDITVQAGATLTIEPGVLVRFSTSDGLGSGTDTSRVEMTIRGTLVANGTPAQPITFQAASGTGSGIWVGLIVESTATSATISNAIVEHAATGLRNDLAGAALNLSATTFRTCSTGLRTTGTSTFDALTFTNDSYGIIVDAGSPTVTNSLFSGIGSYGIQVQSPGSVTAENVTIYGGSRCVTTASATVTIRDSILTGCSYGVYSSSGNYVGSYNDVWGNTTNYYASSGATPSAGTGTISANPLFVSASNLRLTSNSPARFSGGTGDDMGALPYTGDPTPGVHGTLWSNTTIGSGTTSVAGDLTVAPGVTLTILPGATLSFSTSDLMAAYADTSRSELRVLGTISAIGTSASPITMTSSGSGSGSWVGMTLLGTSTASVIDEVIVEEAATGIAHSSTAAQTIVRTTIRNSSTGLRVTTTPATLDALTFTNDSNGLIADSGVTTITNSLFSGTGSYGIQVQSPGSVVAENVTIYGGSRCVTTASATITVRDSILTGCSYGVYSSSGNYVGSYNDVWGNTTNYYASSGATPSAGTGTISANPLFVSASNLRLTSNSPARFSGSTGDDMGVLPYTGDATGGVHGTLWVDTTLGSGTTSVAGDLTVAPGVTLTLLPGATLSFSTSDLMAAYGDTSRSELRVFGTLTAIASSGLPVTMTSTGSGSGSWVGVTLQAGSTGSVLDGVVIEEAATGLTHSSTAPQTIVRSTFRGNSTAMRITTTPVPLDRILFSQNSNGIIADGGATRVSNSVFSGTGSYGIQIQSPASLTAENVTIYGGSRCVTTASATITVRNSILTGCSYGVYSSSGSYVGSYNDVWGNTTNYYASSGATPSAGTGTISANPLFVSASDLHLQASSVCIDAGTPATVPSDFDGVARPLDGDGVGGAGWDIGAHEFVRMLICGDGLVTSPEICDDGPMNGMYGRCNASCSGAGPRCGDAMTNGPEGCDDGNPSNTDACLATCVPASCGDTFVQAGVEDCDDGNSVTTDACIACAAATCGDSYVRMGVEACDDGNAVSTDACISCANAYCGDGYVRGGVEACDDGNTSQTDACLNSCVLARCGDGFVGPGEQCDDGNMVDGDGCSNTCRSASCGDGIVQAGEECDDMNAVNDDACSNACRNARCGDGIRHAGEECDDGNAVNDDSCSNACSAARCGDSILQAGEACDDGNTDPADACTATCTVARCGDGVVRAGMEACDDGNASDTDDCLVSCVAARCGDGHLRAGVEACDDGNTTDGDGCSSSCALASCGNGVTDAGEDCDDGNASNLDACLNTCLSARCGDGFRRTSVEACDDGNTDDTDACVTGCRNASCGDGFVRAGTEDCDDGNGEETDACLTTCAAASCGDGFVEDGVETCDDGDMTPGDGCSASCMVEAGTDGGVTLDGGVTMPDAGTADGGAFDGGGTDAGGADAMGADSGSGVPPVMTSGCSCRTGRSGPGLLGLLLFASLLGVAARRRR